MTAVLLLGRLPVLRVYDQPGRLTSLSVEPGRTGVERLYAHAADELDQSGTVLAVYPTWGSRTLPDQLATVRAGLETARLVPVPLELPPLGIAVLAAQLAAIAGYPVSPGRLVAGVPALARRLVIGAWSRRARGPAGLGSVRLGIRLLSLVPRTRFAVTVQPTPDCVHLRGDAAPPDTWRPDSPSALVYAGRATETGWVRDIAAGNLGPERITAAAPLPDATRWWGSRRVVEIVACDGRPDRLVRALEATVAVRPCGWCAEPVTGDQCPFCAMTNLPRVPVLPGERSAL
jgi:hypothetical protein